MMAQICLLVIMSLMCSVSGRDSEYLRNEAEADSSMDDNMNNQRRQAPSICGRRPGFIDEEYGLPWIDNYSDTLDKILGGSFVKPGEFPWQARVYRNRPIALCGGVIINNYWILTAAKCVYNITSLCDVKIALGRDLLHIPMNISRDFQTTRPVGKIIIHRHYDPRRGYDFDIALVKMLSPGVLFNDKTQPICLPEAGELIPTDTELTFSGWGEDSPWSNRIPVVLKKVVLPVIDHTVCNTEVYPGLITDGLLCAGKVNGNTDACLRDTGGPAVYKSGDVYVLAGIMVGGTGCRLPNTPVIFSSASMYRRWIDYIISNFNTPDLAVVVRV